MRAALLAVAAAASAEARLAFVALYNTSVPGCPDTGYDSSGYTGDSVFAYDLREDGEMRPLSSSAAGLNPSWIVFRRARGGLTAYAISEACRYDGANRSSVASFHVDEATGKMTLTSRVATQTQGPAHASVSDDGRYFLVATYFGGALEVFPIDESGALKAAVFSVAQGPMSHSVVPDTRRGSSAVLSAVLGEDRVAQYHLTADGKLAANGDLPLPQGTGPRHIAFSPAAAPHPRAFVADEGNGTVQAVMTVAAYDPAAGTLRAEAQLSTIADGVNASGMYPSEIAATPDGRWVLVSVRDATSAGRDSVAVFEVGAAGVKAAAYVNAAGHYPRSMAFSRSYTQLVVGNQKSNSVATFAFDVAAGRLTYSGHNVTVPDAPAFVYVV